MSTRSLPDDPARWPDDPRALLGVPANVGPRELRRAYNQLIRTYKPEQFPEEFRRIRAAYESLLPMAEWFGRLSETAEPETNAEPEQRPETPSPEAGDGRSGESLSPGEPADQ